METMHVEQALHIVELLAKGKFEQIEQRLAQEVKPFLPLELLESGWREIEKQFGAFQRVLDIKIVQTPQTPVEVVTCAFGQTQVEINLAFNASAEIIGLTIQPVVSDAPPVYARPDRFVEQEVQVGTGEWALPATLSLPRGQGPFPAVVLVHGSGPQDRDETIPPNKPFRDLAWGLASNGVAVLRYEKRTHIHAQKFATLIETLTVQEETIDDVLLALDVLRRQATIDARQLFILGHSLGGYLLPRILKAPAASGVRGGIILAGSARPLEDVILKQMTYIQSLGEGTPESKQQLAEVARQVARIKDLNLSTNVPSSELLLHVPAAYWLDLRGYQPEQVARTIAQPLFILQAGSDFQVTRDDYQIWQQALSTRPDVTFKEYPDLYHLFIPCEPGKKATPATYIVPGHVAEEVINDLSQWIKAHALR